MMICLYQRRSDTKRVAIKLLDLEQVDRFKHEVAIYKLLGPQEYTVQLFRAFKDTTLSK
jgi:hypothetical protein